MTKSREWASELLNRVDEWVWSAETQWGETGRFALIGLAAAAVTGGLTDLVIRAVVR